MKTMKKKSFLQTLLILFAMFCIFLCSGMNTLGGKQASAEVRAIYENVYIGRVIEAKDYKMQTAGGVAAESMRIVYPSGGIYGSETFIVEQTGLYQVTYYATVDGDVVEETKNYMAIRRPQDMIVADAGMQVEYGTFKYYVNYFRLSEVMEGHDFGDLLK